MPCEDIGPLQFAVQEFIDTERHYEGRLKNILVWERELGIDLNLKPFIEALIAVSQKLIHSDFHLLSPQIRSSFSAYFKAHRELRFSIDDKRTRDILKSFPQFDGLDLQAHLLEPIQRIARYPLLLKQILHHSPPEDKLRWSKALAESEDILRYINEMMREGELEKRFKAANLSGLDFELCGETRVWGPRKLLYEGTLKRRKQNLTGWLLTDVLIFFNEKHHVLERHILEETKVVRRLGPNELLIGEHCYQTDKPADEWAKVLCEQKMRLTKKEFKCMPMSRRVFCGTVEIRCTNTKFMDSYFLKLILNEQNEEFDDKPVVLALSSLDDRLQVECFRREKLRPAEIVGRKTLDMSLLEYSPKGGMESVLSFGSLNVSLSISYSAINSLI